MQISTSCYLFGSTLPLKNSIPTPRRIFPVFTRWRQHSAFDDDLFDSPPIGNSSLTHLFVICLLPVRGARLYGTRCQSGRRVTETTHKICLHKSTCVWSRTTNRVDLVQLFELKTTNMTSRNDDLYHFASCALGSSPHSLWVRNGR